MPNRSEMLSLSNRAPTFPQAEYFTGQAVATPLPSPDRTFFNGFVPFDYYWTSTTSAADMNQAWTVWSCEFGVYNLAKTESRHLLAVR